MQAFLKMLQVEYESGKPVWRRTTAEVRDYFLGAVPPAFYFTRGFAAGEPWDHAPDGKPIYLGFHTDTRGITRARYGTEAELVQR